MSSAQAGSTSIPPRTRAPVRAIDAGVVDIFLVVAVATVLVIRISLEVTNYPQLGGNGLHIAHVLWGGLGMVIAIGLLLAFLSGSVKRIAAIAGGVGFGAFIDELGKFVTADNNYFFRPTAAIVYALFAVLFLVARQVRNMRRLSPAEYLVNAIELSKDIATGTLTEANRLTALALLDDSYQADALVPALRAQFLAYRPRPRGEHRLLEMVASLRRWYVARAGKRWFRRVIAAVFVIRALSALLAFVALTLAFALAHFGVGDAQAALNDMGGPTGWIAVAASLIAGVLTIMGLLQMRRSRLRAYRFFEFSVLVNLLLGQPFNLLDTGFAGAFDVLFDLFLLASLGFMLAQERSAAIPQEPEPA
ncbi:MAG: hypothetical protein WAT58_10265 [Candidatus Dormiibacterota bacterium]